MGKEIDHRTDVFALGICLYETLTGAPLYHHPTEYETMRAVIESPVPSIRDVNPDLPIDLDAIVQKALQKNRNDRWSSAGELQGALEDWLARVGKAVTTARISTLMEKLFEDQIAAGPLVDSTPFGASFRRRPTETGEGGSGSGNTGDRPTVAPGSRSKANAAQAEQAAQAAPAPAPEPPSKRPIVIAGALGAAAVLALVGVVALASGGPDAPPPAPAPSVVAAPPPAPAPEPAPEAAPAPVPAPTQGRMLVRVAVEGATVRIGDRVLGTAEMGVPLAMDPGTYLVHVEHPQHRPWDREIEIRVGEESEVAVELVPRERAPATPPGRLSINTRPWSKVYVGSRLLGTTPIGEAEVPSGNVRLRIVDRDGRTFQRSVRVAAGGSETVFFDLDQPQ
jgi:serine/threonine-protein kinase